MKTILLAAAAATLLASAAYAAGENTCLPTYYIKQTVVSPDEHSITFRMKDGKTWINTLPTKCRGLNLHGFTYTSRTSTEVCAGQGIRLVETGTVCKLGSFEAGPNAPSGSY